MRQFRHGSRRPGAASRKKPDEYREIDYLICTQCNTPCYVFEMDGSRITEAICHVCGNDEVRFFNVGEEAGPDDE